MPLIKTFIELIARVGEVRAERAEKSAALLHSFIQHFDSPPGLRNYQWCALG